MKKALVILAILTFPISAMCADWTWHEQYQTWAEKALFATGVYVEGMQPHCGRVQVGDEIWKQCDTMLIPPGYTGQTGSPVWSSIHTKEMNPCGCWWRYEHWKETFFTDAGPYWVQTAVWPLASVVEVSGVKYCKVGRVMIPESWPFGDVAPKAVYDIRRKVK